MKIIIELIDHISQFLTTPSIQDTRNDLNMLLYLTKHLAYPSMHQQLEKHHQIHVKTAALNTLNQHNPSPAPCSKYYTIGSTGLFALKSRATWMAKTFILDIHTIPDNYYPVRQLSILNNDHNIKHLMTVEAQPYFQMFNAHFYRRLVVKNRECINRPTERFVIIGNIVSLNGSTLHYETKCMANKIPESPYIHNDSMAWTSKTAPHTLYVFGNNTNGILGQGKTPLVHKPTPVAFPGMDVKQVFLKGQNDNVIILTEETQSPKRHLFVSGQRLFQTSTFTKIPLPKEVRIITQMHASDQGLIFIAMSAKKQHHAYFRKSGSQHPVKRIVTNVGTSKINLFEPRWRQWAPEIIPTPKYLHQQPAQKIG